MSFYRTFFEKGDLLSKSRAVQELFVKIHLNFKLLQVGKGGSPQDILFYKILKNL